MTTKTRYFVIVSLLALAVGMGTGLVAYYVGFSASASANPGGPDELRLIPRDATVIGVANVQEVMASELRQKIHRALPGQEDGQRELQERTGINLETDIDRVVACLRADPDSPNMPGAGMVLARGRFDETKIEAVMRERGAQVEAYKGKRLIVADLAEAARREIEKRRATGDLVPDAAGSVDPRMGNTSFALAFVEPGLVALGSTTLIRSAIDLHQGGANSQTGLQSVTGNDELMILVRSLDSTSNAWTVGRFDALALPARLPQNVSSQLPAITWFSVGAHVNGGVRGVIRAETRDDEAAANLRDVLRGFMALVKLQSGSKPELQAMMQSLELGGTGTTVALSFAVPAEVFDVIGAAANLAIKPGGR
jgi:hypothetical protein